MEIKKIMILVMILFFCLGLINGALADTQEVTPVGTASDIRYFDGNVGIGTTNPASQLTLVKENQDASIVIRRNYSENSASAIDMYHYLNSFSGAGQNGRAQINFNASANMSDNGLY